MTQQNFIEDLDISYADMEQQGFAQSFINDYQGFKQSMRALSGTDADPNGLYTANLTGWYVDTSTPGLWFNPAPGARTGWIQLV